LGGKAAQTERKELFFEGASPLQATRLSNYIHFIAPMRRLDECIAPNRPRKHNRRNTFAED
jgi:hypothetical protein